MPTIPTEILGIAEGGGHWVTCNSPGSSGPDFYTSSNGSTWTGVTPGLGRVFQTIAYGAGSFVVGSDTGGTGSDTYAVSTNNGATWSQSNTFNSDGFVQIIHDGSQFVGINLEAGTGNYRIATSPDGNTWTVVGLFSGSPVVNCMAFGGGHYVACTNIGTSRSATTLAGLIAAGDIDMSISGASVGAVTFGNGTFVAVAVGGVAASSTNSGGSWTLEDPQFSGNDGTAICFVGGGSHKFCAGANAGQISLRTGG